MLPIQIVGFLSLHFSFTVELVCCVQMYVSVAITAGDKNNVANIPQSKRQKPFQFLSKGTSVSLANISILRVKKMNIRRGP